jgi:hypothetical protein
MALSDKQIIEKAEHWWGVYADQIADLLGLDTYDTPKFTVKDIKPTGKVGDAAAYASNTKGVIVLDRDWFKSGSYDVGAIVHEATHFISSHQTLGEKSRFIEGVADAVRARLGLTPPGWKAEGFAAVLAEMPHKAFKEVTAKMREGTFTKQDAQELKAQYSQPAGTPYVPATDGGGGGGDDGGDGAPWRTDPDAIPPYRPGGNWKFTNGSWQWTAGGGGGQNAEDRQERREERRERQQEARERRRERIERRRREARRDRRAAFMNTLQQWGIPMTQNLNELVTQGAGARWTASTFLHYLRKTPDYRQAFPGIFNEDGTLKMSEGTYMITRDRYEDIAATSGLNINDRKIATLFKRDVSAAEFADRAPAIARLNRDKALYAGFQKELVQGGIAKAGEVSKEELFKFILGEGNKEWYDLWQDTVTRNAAREAGIRIAKNSGQYSSIGQGMIEKISGKGLSEAQLQSGFQELGDTLLEVLPLSKIHGFGLSKGLVQQAVFGGKNAAQARKKIQHVLETEEAFWESPRAAQQTYAGEGGKVVTQGVRSGPATE